MWLTDLCETKGSPPVAIFPISSRPCTFLSQLAYNFFSRPDQPCCLTIAWRASPCHITAGERIYVGDKVFEDDMFQGMAQLADAVATARGAAKAPPEAELQEMLAEDWEDLRANQFLNMGYRFMLEDNNMDTPELLGQHSQASELGECSN